MIPALVIALASPSDTVAVHRIAQSVALGWSGSESCGFLISGSSVGHFSGQIEKGNVLVARVDKQVVGYLVFEPWSSPEMVATRDLLASIEVDGRPLSEIPNLVWLESIGVGPDHMKSGIGSALIASLFSRYPKSRIISAIAEKPHRNGASARLHQKAGFVRVATFKSPKFMGLLNYESGIYLSAAANEHRE